MGIRIKYLNLFSRSAFFKKCKSCFKNMSFCVKFMFLNFLKKLPVLDGRNIVVIMN